MCVAALYVCVVPIAFCVPSSLCTGAVVRDLFKSHFSSLQQAVRGPKAAHHHQDAIQAHQAQHQAAEEDDCLTVQQDRQSFSAK